MTPEQQRIAIAKACGWTVRPDMSMYLNDKNGCMDGTVPDYLNDLNAMHEAYHTLEPDQQTDFVRWLRSVVVQSPAGISHFGQLINATASQRAEAFLRTLNLWKD